MATIDWIIFAAMLGLLLAVAWWCRRYLKSVADFIVVDRKMRMYLGLSTGMADGLGLIGIAQLTEQGFLKGLGYVWMLLLNLTFSVVVYGIFGFGIRRFRATCVQTIPQFHEMRYSRGVRICVGIALATGGILNMAIFPIVSSQLLVHFLDLPQWIPIGNFAVQTTHLCMIVLVSVSLATAIFGGMVTAIVTDYVQSIIIAAMLIFVTLLIFTHIGVSEMDAVLSERIGPAAYNPFIQGNAESSYGFAWVVFFILSGLLGPFTFPPSTAKISAADSTDTTRKMALIGGLFGGGRSIMVVLWGVAALVAIGATTGGELPKDYARYASAEFVRDLLPVGMVGMCAAAMVFAYMATDNGYYLAWSATVVNDVIAPLRGRPLSQRQHLFLLRVVMAAIAGFLVFWGIVYGVKETIVSYLYLTGAIFTAAGILTVFGLYWKRANVLGAYCTVAICMIVPLADLIGKQIFEKYPLKEHQSGLFALLAAIGAFVVCGLVDRSGHKKWVDYGVAVRAEDAARRQSKGREGGFHMSTMAIVTFSVIGVLAFLYSIFVVWVSIGGAFDLRAMFRDLERERVDLTDDGFVDSQERAPATSHNQ